jgi:hypothetical protein
MRGFMCRRLIMGEHYMILEAEALRKDAERWRKARKLARYSPSAEGCDCDLAMGAMHALPDLEPMQRLEAGLRAAAYFSAGVAPPFNFLTLNADGRVYDPAPTATTEPG